MKVKCDFVTNSSSTNFVFLFNGEDIDDLLRKISKYRKYFDLDCDFGGYRINHIDVIESIQEGIEKNKKIDYENIDIQDIKLLIDERKELLSFYLNIVEDYKEKSLDQDCTYEYNLIGKVLADINLLKAAKDKGFKAIEIGFGDNHGFICGGPVGETMDYEGRKLFINEDDFIVFTEQDR
jgi:hypothetical protein